MRFLLAFSNKSRRDEESSAVVSWRYRKLVLFEPLLSQPRHLTLTRPLHAPRMKSLSSPPEIAQDWMIASGKPRPSLLPCIGIHWGKSVFDYITQGNQSRC